MAMLRLGLPLKIPGTQANTFVYHINDGYVYQQNRGKPGVDTTFYFKCAQYEGRRCYGRAIYSVGHGFLSKADTHNHPPDFHEAAERELQRKILQRCRTTEYVSFQQIINEERRPYHIDVKCRISLASLQPAMQRTRRSIYPEPPNTMPELTRTLQRRQNRIITMTKDGEDNIYAASVIAGDGSHSIIFASRRMLQFAKDHLEFLFGDGTFKVVPALQDLGRASQMLLHECQTSMCYNHIVKP
ncbi:Cadherin-related family member 1 [Frankliniella fusca]|uniref:Cadherin-related family member 1 n=1 Tax=Frankliniella fusca TaxID=407009 RepID=A0AAE1GWJ5_9NEOP|nr:Cadherin-related family member 1 [Frankliniella fusca]